MSTTVASTNGDWVALHRSVAPYIGIGTIIGGVSIYATAAGLGKDPWGTLEVNAVLWAIFAGWVYFGMRYRIYWRYGEIRQRASGKPDLVLKISDLESVSLETAVDAGRPFRRIALYAGSDTQSQFIDVSLKHFVANDVRDLMRAIHAARPDLAIPSPWL